LAEEGKATSERRFRSLFENAPIPIREEDVSGIKTLIDTLNIPDPDAFGAHLDAHPEFLQACAETITVVDANRASLALHGYTDKNEMLSRVVRTLSPTSMQIVRRTVETIHAGLPGTSYETAITRTDGETRTVAATWSVMPGHETTYARILLTSVDITDRLASEAALRQAQKMEAVGQLTGGVAHDFNNLLTVIGGNAELLNETAELDPELTSPIVKAVRRGADLTQRLLAFSRNQPLEPKPLDLGELVGGMTELLQRSLGEEISVEIRNRNAGWLALADPGQVEAALLNMALNSRDAMPRGGKLTISIDDHTVPEGGDAQLAPGDYMVLSVCDTGTGMTRHTIDHAFEPFFTTKEVGKGSGLGLSMIYGFAKQSDGDARIQSELGAGSTVSLYLPRATSAGVRTATPAKDCGRAMGNGEQILVLEDDPEVRAYLLTLLEKQGYRSVPAEDARAARAMLADGHSFDLLISDVMLPGGVLGPEFAAEFVRERPGVPVLFISGRPSGPKLTELDGLADAPLISKPFERAEIAEKIASLLNPA
ncbi:MAG: ATP-binding protein, partial [Pseudomonadota bacterium]